jgi:nucleoid-associated protein Lsr2
LTLVPASHPRVTDFWHGCWASPVRLLPVPYDWDGRRLLGNHPVRTVALEDDLTGGSAVETLRFAFEGTDYEIDLNAKNAAAFGKQLAPYLEHARRAGRAPVCRARRTALSQQRSGDIRAWAKEHGLAVSERGRIPASVMEQYLAAGNGH